jgi:hypothetical protein
MIFIKGPSKDDSGLLFSKLGGAVFGSPILEYSKSSRVSGYKSIEGETERGLLMEENILTI